MGRDVQGGVGFGRPANRRSLSVGQDVKKILADIFIREDAFGLTDGRSIVTVTQVRLRDPYNAVCYISFFSQHAGEQEIKAFFASLNRIKGYVRKRLAGCLKLRFVPDLVFKPDPEGVRTLRTGA